MVSGLKGILKRLLYLRDYNKYDEIVFVSKDNLSVFEYKIKNNISKRVIYNYIDKNRVLQKANERISFQTSEENINLLTVSRLVEQKAIGRWIGVHSKLIKEGIKFKVYVIGDGPLKRTLKDRIQKEKIEDSFILLGSKKNPYPYIKKCDYFCLLSYYEGYGMVLEEAKILNKPILITDTAAREGVNNYEGAKIFENSEEGIYNGLKKVFNQKVETTKNEYKENKSILKIIELIEE